MSSGTITCRECGKDDKASNYMAPTSDEMVRRQLCFDCLYWMGVIASKGPDVAVVDGHIYVIRPSSNLPRFSRGFGGDQFSFRFADGRKIVSNDVWNGSSIPAHFRGRLPNNATLIARSAA